jgi:hypothetical protein
MKGEVGEGVNQLEYGLVRTFSAVCFAKFRKKFQLLQKLPSWWMEQPINNSLNTLFVIYTVAFPVGAANRRSFYPAHRSNGGLSISINLKYCQMSESDLTSGHF